MIELEKRFLVKELPDNIFASPSKEIIDQYIPKNSVHAYVRVRKNGDHMMITKKKPIEGDSNRLKEETIVLDEAEWRALSSLPAKTLHKTRYFYEWNNYVLEVGVFQGDLKGLVLVDVEFSSPEDMDSFTPPDWFLAEVHDEEFAGGWLCGKTLSDLEEKLKKYHYTPL